MNRDIYRWDYYSNTDYSEISYITNTNIKLYLSKSNQVIEWSLLTIKDYLIYDVLYCTKLEDLPLYIGREEKIDKLIEFRFRIGK